MKCSMRVAVTLGVGYLLGRRRKLRAATVMAVAAAASGTSVGRTALRRGAEQLVNSRILDKVSPQVGEIVDAVRGDLLDAAKAVASAEVASKIEALTDSLHDRAESLRNLAAETEAGGESEGEEERPGAPEREAGYAGHGDREAEGGRRRRAEPARMARERVPRQRSSDEQPRRRPRVVSRRSRE